MIEELARSMPRKSCSAKRRIRFRWFDPEALRKQADIYKSHAGTRAVHDAVQHGVVATTVKTVVPRRLENDYRKIGDRHLRHIAIAEI